MPQKYYSSISINAAQVPSTQTNFPVLVSQIDARFKSVANGGHVSNSSGFDIRPYSDTSLATPLTYELERYNASTGELIMWVKVPSLSSSTTPIYIGYGDTSISTDGSSSTTWDSNFTGVYHLKDGSTLNVNSATGSNNGTNHSATATTGQIDGAASFDSASSQYIGLGTAQSNAELTYSAWINATSLPSANNTVVGYTAAAGRQCIMYISSAGHLVCSAGAGTPHTSTGTNTVSTGTWYHVAMIYTAAGGIKGYFNGAADGTAASDGGLTTGPEIDIAREPLGASSFWNGAIDEVRISSPVRTADWITTEYNSGIPSSFETLGAEIPIFMVGLFRI